MSLDFSISMKGRVAVVTGGAAGIGQAVAAELLRQGCVVGAVDRTADGVPDGVTPLVADVRDQGALNAAIGGFGERHGRIDFLVNNAGVSFVGTIEDGSEEDWARLFDINVMGQMRSTRAALPHLRKSDAGAIVNMSSCTAMNGLRQRALYSASKGAVQSMTMAMAADLIAEGIRVNCIAPGTVDTPFMAELAARAPDPAAKRAEFAARQPSGLMVDPLEVALAVVFLLRPGANGSVGTCLTIDGGMAALRVPPRPVTQP
ncbi:NAD(P)-dependent dehydrogenase (short-subunit alcohol dehydrogenase family) [Azospirillum agricola]|uniref:SDR family NAD(P)-dependent oxidoreductase n=1 Tax=Azospirillum agricola TaxID=1720247 RepID=UPI001AE3E04A|nr:SDR family oxidoreductase [Azospirillum agricola]MBP2227883.1 NAD(P)-dependent dehydrogenase (short-subunit alcohol dehydrogenase family) [Azospirillum agricola]